MSERKVRRGRPKGSEIDDSGQLRAIARLIADDPELKPTTAIRSLGISDPSTIRRLRDKYNARREKLEARISAASQSSRDTDIQPNSQSASQATRPTLQALPGNIEARTMALELPNWDVITEAVNQGALNGAAPRQSRSDAQRKPRRDPRQQGLHQPGRRDQAPQGYVEPVMRGSIPINPGTVAVAWWSVGVKSWATMAGINLALCQKLAKLPTAQAAVRQQVELNNLVLDALLGMSKPKKYL